MGDERTKILREMERLIDGLTENEINEVLLSIKTPSCGMPADVFFEEFKRKLAIYRTKK